MDKMCKYEVYHASDKSNVKQILKDRFIYKPNNVHWLGNGVYFFLDKTLAKKWSEQKVRGYGKIIIPAYIKCQVEINENNVLDLRFLEEYNFAKEAFSSFVENINGKYDLENCDYAKIRCLFFNYIKKQYDFYCIIANFCERNNLDDYTLHDREFQNIKMPYIEAQMCLNLNEYIVRKEEVEI